MLGGHTAASQRIPDVRPLFVATAHDMKSARYHRAVLNSVLWNAMLVLLARFDPRDLLLRFGQAAQVLLLDILKVETDPTR